LIDYDSQNQINPSVDFIHYNARRDKNGVLTSTDDMNVRSGFKAIKRYGVCHAHTFPNNAFYDDITPGDAAYNEAELYKSIEYYRVYDNDLSELRKCIAMGFPVIFALELFDSSGVGGGDVWTHSPENQGSVGSVAFVAVGYDDISGLIEFRNFRGECWGDSGYGFINYDYMKKHAHSMWVLRTVTYDDDDNDMF
jgi:C1A family cysteine protease